MAAMNEGNLTKFIWRIDNFSSIEDGTLQSPSFRSHSVEWRLKMYPSSNKILINFNLEQLDSKPISINYSIAFVDPNGLPMIWRQCNKAISKQERSAFNIENFNINMIRVVRKKLFGSMKSKFLFNDTLTVDCRIWELTDLLLKPLTCLAQTRFEPLPLKPIKKTIVLKVDRVSFLPKDSTLEHVEQNTWDGDSLKLLVLFSDECEFSVYVMVPLFTILANIKVSVIDVTMKRHEFADVKFKFDDKIEERSFRTQITKLMLTTYKNEFLPKDSLSLEFQFTLFFKISFSRLVANEDNFVNNTGRRVSPLCNHKAKPEKVKQDIKPVTKSDQPSDASETLKNIYEEGFLADFTLKAGGKTFQVHKNILGARSSVFRAMFTADMKEKERGSVDIPDVDADTIKRMLKFVYCDSVEEDMQWESASSLYAAANKYALEPLKQRCSDILKSGMCPSSVLGALVLANTHQDEAMRATALDFILEHDKEIIGSEPWSKFAEEHGKLAFDAIQRVYLMKIDG